MKKNVLMIFALMLILMATVFTAIYHKTGKLPIKVVGLVVFTCLPPVGMLAYTNKGSGR